jgi:molybdate transport system substrate-binding protein
MVSFKLILIRRIRLIGLVLFGFLTVSAGLAETARAQTSVGVSKVHIAVATNFKGSLEQLLQVYASRYPQEQLFLSAASSGVLANQIKHGAPFELFLSADAARPTMLEQENFIKKGSRVTYARGQLALWRPKGQNIDEQWLRQYSGQIALANPTFAPFGAAATEVLAQLNLGQNNELTIITANNVAQVAQMLSLGAVDVGFVAYSQVQKQPKSQVWLIPPIYYNGIDQQMVLLANATPQAERFYQFLLSDEAQLKITEMGYLPRVILLEKAKG